MTPPIFDLLLALTDGPGDAERILAGLREHGSRPPSIASFYRTMRRAVEHGYVEVEAVESAGPLGPGRPPQRYRMTAAGKAALRAEGRRLAKLAKLALAEARPGGTQGSPVSPAVRKS